jgi:hypothetical protein
VQPPDYLSVLEERRRRARFAREVVRSVTDSDALTAHSRWLDACNDDPDVLLGVLIAVVERLALRERAL